MESAPKTADIFGVLTHAAEAAFQARVLGQGINGATAPQKKTAHAHPDKDGYFYATHSPGAAHYCGFVH